MSARGELIIVDGISGSGKTSLLDTLQSALQERGTTVYQFREEDLDSDRDQILAVRNAAKQQGRSGNLEMTQVLVDHRASIYKKHVEPALQQGQVGLADRGEPATLAYQTKDGDVSMDMVWNLHRRAGIQRPNAVFITVCSPETAVARQARDASIKRLQDERGRGLSGKVTFNADASTADKVRKTQALIEQYGKTDTFLKRKKVPTLTLNTESMSLTEELDQVLKFLRLK